MALLAGVTHPQGWSGGSSKSGFNSRSPIYERPLNLPGTLSGTKDPSHGDNKEAAINYQRSTHDGPSSIPLCPSAGRTPGDPPIWRRDPLSPSSLVLLSSVEADPSK